MSPETGNEFSTDDVVGGSSALFTPGFVCCRVRISPSKYSICIDFLGSESDDHKSSSASMSSNKQSQGSIFIFSRASIPKNMLALAKFWLPFQKWRIIGKKRRQNGYMLKNLCVFVLTSYDASLQYM